MCEVQAHLVQRIHTPLSRRPFDKYYRIVCLGTTSLFCFDFSCTRSNDSSHSILPAKLKLNFCTITTYLKKSLFVPGNLLSILNSLMDPACATCQSLEANTLTFENSFGWVFSTDHKVSPLMTSENMYL